MLLLWRKSTDFLLQFDCKHLPVFSKKRNFAAKIKPKLTMNKTIGILTAMSVEFNQVASMLTDSRHETFGPQQFLVGSLGKNTVVLLQCGIGKVNAATGVTNMIIRYQPQCVISTGVAGGIDKVLRVMDVVVSTQTCYHDVSCGEDVDPGQIQGLPRFFEGDSTMVSVATNLDAEVRVVPGLICTGDQFISDRHQLDQIKKEYPQGLAVDMESAAIAQVCYLYNVPFVSFRIISDTPGVEEHFETYLNFWETMANKSFAITRSFLNKL